MARKKINLETKIILLTESGYRCGVPTCRSILALDFHHIIEVSEKGGNETSNLIALCPTCHALFHRGTISKESIYCWKQTLISLTQAFDTSSIDDLLFLNKLPSSKLMISGDGVLKFSRLIGIGFVEFDIFMQNGPIILYEVKLTEKGSQFIENWEKGNINALQNI